MNISSFRLHNFGRRRRRWQTGFSLVEVTLAIGIVSFGLLTVVGVIPVGMSTLRQAMDQTVEAQIVQKLNAEMTLTPFSQLAASFDGKFLYYNEVGEELASRTGARYEVTPKMGDAAYPGGTAVPTSKCLQLIQFQIVKLEGSQDKSKFNILVANSGN